MMHIPVSTILETSLASLVRNRARQMEIEKPSKKVNQAGAGLFGKGRKEWGKGLSGRFWLRGGFEPPTFGL